MARDRDEWKGMLEEAKTQSHSCGANDNDRLARKVFDKIKIQFIT